MEQRQPIETGDPLVAELFLEATDGLVRHLEPVTCGIPWPKGYLRDPSLLGLRDEQGAEIPLQAKCLDRWPDGSVRWVLLDWQANVEVSAAYRVGLEPVQGSPKAGPKIVATDRGGGEIQVDTGLARFFLSRQGAFPFESIIVDESAAIDSARTRFEVVDQSDTPYEPKVNQVKMTEAGPIRAVVQLEGELVGEGRNSLCRFILELHFFAGSATVRFALTLHNPKASGHPGGCWDLGNDGSIYLRDASFTFTLPPGDGAAIVTCSPEHSDPFRQVGTDFELYQDSSGGENWRSTNHINRQRVVPNSFRGYRFRSSEGEESGLRSTPIVALVRDKRTLSLAMEHFWQNFPKAIEASRDSLTIRLFPRQYSDVHEIQGGEQKTHFFYVAYGADGVTEPMLGWCRSPLRPHARPSWYCSSGAIPYLTPKTEDPNLMYLALVDSAIEGNDTFDQKREIIDEYGWRHFGDVYGDHEAVFHPGPTPLVSHYNNQYDNIAGFAYQFLRSGDIRWWGPMEDLARHVIDIDIYHTSLDRWLYNNGLFWHTFHYVDADTATHRSYPKAGKVNGGGPGGGNNYSMGLMLYYFLTGDSQSRSAAISLGHFVIDMDDGRKAKFGWLDASPHGHATVSGLMTYHGPGRAPANSLNALLNAYRLTKDAEYLEKAEQIIRRCIHPRDDINARNLLDAENKWFYTMFLQALGRYLDDKEEYGSTDRMYYYARESLLQYARWMAEHEYPYLDKPEILEYPTETWAAQDMRKSDVFKFAAKHAGVPERPGFLDRSDFFFQASTTTLATMPTRTLARPVILLLGNGFMHAYYQRHPEHASLIPPHHDFDFGTPQEFIPQKVRVIRKLKTLAAAGVILVLLAAAGLALSFLLPR